MHLVPIPVTPEHLRATEPIWFPFLERISSRSGEPVASLFDRIMSGEVQPILVWDGEKARALTLLRFFLEGADKVGEWFWMAGDGRRDWQHLLPDVERYMRDMGCTKTKAVPRKGWARHLQDHGYRTTYYIMEKRL